MLEGTKMILTHFLDLKCSKWNLSGGARRNGGRDVETEPHQQRVMARITAVKQTPSNKFEEWQFRQSILKLTSARDLGACTLDLLNQDDFREFASLAPGLQQANGTMAEANGSQHAGALRS